MFFKKYIKQLLVGSFLMFTISASSGKDLATAGKKSYSESFVQVSKSNPFYFQLSNGEPYIVNGPCLAGATDMETMKNYLKKISENGGNFARVWLSSSLFEIEQKYGAFDSEKIRNIDSLINWASKYNIKLKLCLEHFRQITPDPKASFNKPQYHVDNGGPFHNMDEYINTEKGKQVFLKKVNFLKSRYGDNPVVFGWELWNEMNGIMCQGLRAWNDFMLPAVHRIFTKNLIMQSLGSFDMESRRPDYKYINSLTSNDVAQIHRYIDAGAKLDICTAPMDDLSADAIDELRSYNLHKPMLLAEVGAVLPNHTGPSDLYPLDKAGILMHDMLFAPFFRGAAGTGNSWHWDKYIDRNDLWFHFARFSESVKGINPIKENFIPITQYNKHFKVNMLAGKNTVLIWCRDSENSWNAEFIEGINPTLISNASIDLANLISEKSIKKVSFYDPWQNRWTEGDKKQLIEIPAFYRSLIIKIEKTATNETPEISGSRILRVPEQYSTIAKAVSNANVGDTVIISPGNYAEKNVQVTKSMTITSEWMLTGNTETIGKTLIDAGNAVLFSVESDGVEISGLKIVNGDHAVSVSANAKIAYNHFVNNRDAISMEGGSGGYVGYNLIENDRDDGLDIDIGDDSNKTIGSNITIEYNTIVNSNDDAIEIRLFTRPNQNIRYQINNNIFLGSKNAGIQLISYDVYTGKEFYIYNNLIRGCKVALGCMEGAGTDENLQGAASMDEVVYFFNNTIIENQMAATGGNNMMAANNLICNNKLGGFKRFGKSSVVVNNLFWNNNKTDLIEFFPGVETLHNNFNCDPNLDFSLLIPSHSAGCVATNRLITEFEKNELFDFLKLVPGNPVIGISAGIKGLGAPLTMNLQVSAGENQVVFVPKKATKLQGKLFGNTDSVKYVNWKMIKGTAVVKFKNSNQLVTEVVFNKTGIYEFLLSAQAGDKKLSDKLLIKYAENGSGQNFMVTNEKEYHIEAESFSYSFNQVKQINNRELSSGKAILLQSNKGDINPFTEYNLGFSDHNEYFLWVRIRGLVNENKLVFDFDHEELGTISIQKSESFQWLKLPQHIAARPGQWTLVLKQVKGKMAIDKIVLTTEREFAPAD